MRFLHCSDLHLGRKLYEYSLEEDQAHILDQLARMAEEEKADAVLVAGDVYDKGIPSLDAVGLLDDFLTRLSSKKIPVYLISGNHDSADRLAFGGRLLRASGVHLASGFSGRAQCVRLQDEYGPLCLWSLPFVRPSAVRAAFPEKDIPDYTAAVRVLVEAMGLDTGIRNLLMAHQFVTAGGKGPETSESETVSLGTLDNVDASVLDDFDYVALGHIHRPQCMGRPEVRYCGAPLAYSVTESTTPKTATLVELGQKGSVQITELPLLPLHPLRQITGELSQLLAHGVPSQDYVYAVLTDPVPPVDGAGRLRALYPNLVRMEVRLPGPKTGAAKGPELSKIASKSPAELFREFYAQVHGREMEPEELRLLYAALDEEVPR